MRVYSPPVSESHRWHLRRQAGSRSHRTIIRATNANYTAKSSAFCTLKISRENSLVQPSCAAFYSKWHSSLWYDRDWLGVGIHIFPYPVTVDKAMILRPSKYLNYEQIHVPVAFSGSPIKLLFVPKMHSLQYMALLSIGCSPVLQPPRYPIWRDDPW